MWATFFWKSGHLASFSDGWHFAGVSHTALGYGDVVLPKPWGMPVLSAFLGCCISAKWGRLPDGRLALPENDEADFA